MKAALAQGYEGNRRITPIHPRPAGQLVSLANEMARFVRMMLNRGTLGGVSVVSADSITRMETPGTGLAAKAGLKYGYALGTLASLHPFIAHGHDGGLDGFLSNFQYLPDQGLGYFFSINRSDSDEPIVETGDLIFDYLTLGLTSPPKPPAVPLDSQITQWTGFYEYASPRIEKIKFIEILLQVG